MKQIIIIKPNSISAKEKAELIKDGNIVIEHNIPSKIVFKNTIPNDNSYTYTCCCNCGERIYVTQERLKALKDGKSSFYRSHGHSQSYS